MSRSYTEILAAKLLIRVTKPSLHGWRLNGQEGTVAPSSSRLQVHWLGASFPSLGALGAGNELEQADAVACPRGCS